MDVTLLELRIDVYLKDRFILRIESLIKLWILVSSVVLLEAHVAHSLFHLTTLLFSGSLAPTKHDPAPPLVAAHRRSSRQARPAAKRTSWRDQGAAVSAVQVTAPNLPSR